MTLFADDFFENILVSSVPWVQTFVSESQNTFLVKAFNLYFVAANILG